MQRACRLFTVGGLVAFAVVLACRRLDDFDLPWHLATGRVLASHGVPRLDPLAYTHRPLGYTTIFADLLLYGVWRLAGPLGLQVFGGLTAATLGALLLARARGSGQGSGASSLFVVSPALVTLRPWLSVRPATLSFVLLGATLLLLDTHRRGPTSRPGRLALAALTPVQLIWANAHGFAALGAWIAVGYLGHRVIAKVTGGRWPSLVPPRDGEGLGRTAVSVALAVGATCLSTAGPGLLLGTRRAGEDFGHITEWARPSLAFFVDQEPAYMLLLAATALALAVGREQDTASRVPPLIDLALMLGAILFSLLVVRGVPIAAVALAPLAARRLSPLVPDTAVASLAGALSMFAPPIEGVLGNLERGLGFSPKHFPEGAVEWIEQTHPSGHMLNFMPFGGYLAWRLYPAYEVFMDGRNTLAREPSLVQESVQAEFDPTAFDSLVQEFDIQWAITRASPGEIFGVPLARDAGWALTYLDDSAAVYVRRDGPNGRLASAGYRVLRHLTSPGDALGMAVGGTRPDDMAHDGDLAHIQAPASVRGLFFDACGAIAIKDEARFAQRRTDLRATETGPALDSALEQAWSMAGRQ